MQPRRFNVVTDGQWGSTGKGAIATALAARYRPELLSTTNAANAGHTAVNVTGEDFVAKALPAPAILSKWLSDYRPQIVVGPTAAFHLGRMLEETSETNNAESTVIHPRAGIITEQHRLLEAGDSASSTKHIASTMQGCGTFLADKVLRKKDLKLARDYPELANYAIDNLYKKSPIPDVAADQKFVDQPLHMVLHRLMETYGATILHEGSQGFSLDISHGSQYPNCTSRSTTASQNLTDMGISPRLLGDVYIVVRPYPIRVGNVIEDGKTVGYSGDCYSDQREISWVDVAQAAGAPEDIAKGELTTVTKRLRRVFTFSEQQFKEAAIVNGATKIAFNFANYVDWQCFGTNDPDKLPPKVTDFIKKLEDLAGLPVTMVGTGPRLDHVCFL